MVTLRAQQRLDIEREWPASQAIRPTTVIFTAAARFPLAKPVQEMVMPLVGTRAASSSPSAM
jgi:hypothetical protein